MEHIKFRLTGANTMLMHSDKFADPLNPATKAHKALTSTRKKADEVHEAIARSEFIGGCYWSKAEGFHLPGVNVEASFLAGAKLQKLGVKFKQAARVLEDALPLAGIKAKTPEALWAIEDHRDSRSVKVGQARIVRYRPRFNAGWSIEGTLLLDADVLNPAEVRKAMTDAGNLIGVGDYRPRFGRFDVEFI